MKIKQLEWQDSCESNKDNSDDYFAEIDCGDDFDIKYNIEQEEWGYDVSFNGRDIYTTCETLEYAKDCAQRHFESLAMSFFEEDAQDKANSDLINAVFAKNEKNLSLDEAKQKLGL